MAKECDENLLEIVHGFQKCRNAFTAIGEIAQKAHLTRPSVSHHLQILKESGIVAMRKEGTKNYYYLSVDGTQWKEIADLINLIYASIRHISSQP